MKGGQDFFDSLYLGNYDEDDETTVMSFGELFQMYTRISSKVHI